MSGKWKILVAVSLALNLFLIGLVVGGGAIVLAQLKEQRARQAPALMAVARELPPETREQVGTALRAAGREAGPDLREARRLRREAVSILQADTLDPAAARAALERSRAAEFRGRAKLDTAIVATFEDLDPETRKALAPAIMRRVMGGRGGHARPHERPADARGAEAPAKQ